MAIEALENIHNRLIATDRRGLRYDEAEALDACKEALEQPAQEPVAWMNDIAFSMDKELLGTRSRIVPLYTHPAPAKEFVTLTDDDISRVIGNMRKDNHGNLFNDFDFAYAIGQATALKNGMELSDG
jgi:hypothetical protein